MAKRVVEAGQIVSIVFLLVLMLSGCPAIQPGAGNNANLSALVISQGTLSPVFSAEVTSYTTWEQSTVTLITVTPTAENDAASITVNGTDVASGVPSGNITLFAGPDTITIEVTAEDGTTTRTYTIALYRAAGLPRTGQTTQYDGEEDDGYFQTGVLWPNPRFTDNLDGTITDNLTGLMWDQTGNRFGIRTWAQALSDCNSLSLGGHSDWRLPNRKELRSLVNNEELVQSAWLNGQDFSNVQAGFYWSSTTYAPTEAWYVDMGNGFANYSGKTVSYDVLAVRSGQVYGDVSLPKTGQTTLYATGDDGDLERGLVWPSPRFTYNGDGTITDNLTGLMWDQTGNRFGTSTWAQAFIDVASLILAGYSDWRLPNVTELDSLINAGETDPAAWLNGQGFNNVPAGYYWSSTTYAPVTTEAWGVDMVNGRVGNPGKTGNRYVLAVRAGQ